MSKYHDVHVVFCKDCCFCSNVDEYLYCNHPDNRNPYGCGPCDFCDCGILSPILENNDSYYLSYTVPSSRRPTHVCCKLFSDVTSMVNWWQKNTNFIDVKFLRVEDIYHDIHIYEDVDVLKKHYGIT